MEKEYCLITALTIHIKKEGLALVHKAPHSPPLHHGLLF